jgi:hypothetical protein
MRTIASLRATNSPGGSTSKPKTKGKPRLCKKRGAKIGAFPEDLSKVIQFWPALSEPVKQLIVGIAGKRAI